MQGGIIFYNFKLSKYEFTFTISKCQFRGNYLLTYTDERLSLDSCTIDKIKVAREYMSYLDMMKNLKRELINFRNSSYEMQNFEYNPPDTYITNILDMNLNVFIRLKNEKKIEMQLAYIQTITTIESNMDNYKFLLVVKKGNIILQYTDIFMYIMSYL
jgi:hypothetical protein